MRGGGGGGIPLCILHVQPFRVFDFPDIPGTKTDRIIFAE